MSFLEIAVLVILAFILYRLFVPLQQRLEWSLLKFFKKYSKKKKDTIIDVTDYQKKDK